MHVKQIKLAIRILKQKLRKGTGLLARIFIPALFIIAKKKINKCPITGD